MPTNDAASFNALSNPLPAMHVLLTGADGFIGSALVDALARRGHALTLGVRNVEAAARRWPQHRVMAMDFSVDDRVDVWKQRLDGIDAVVNAVGIFRERGAQTFAAIHTRTPIALFEAAAAMRIGRVVQLSALGAEPNAVTEFLRSKYAADVALAALPLRATVVRPSLVFAPEGTSAQMFLRLAALPLIPLPGEGEQCVQPIHRDDLVAVIVALLDDAKAPTLLNAVGPQALRLRAYLASLRRALGAGRPRFVPLPAWSTRAAASMGKWLPGGLLDSDTLRMLERGNCADAGEVVRVLGREPRPVTAFLPSERTDELRRWAQLQWLLPLLRWSLALVWIITGLLSLGLYPVGESLTLLARVGLTGTPAVLALYTAAVFDIVLGLAVLLLRRRRWVYITQAAVIIGYTLIISLRLPEFWLHPYAPVLKNLPLLAMLWLLYVLDGNRAP